MIIESHAKIHCRKSREESFRQLVSHEAKGWSEPAVALMFVYSFSSTPTQFIRYSSFHSEKDTLIMLLEQHEDEMLLLGVELNNDLKTITTSYCTSSSNCLLKKVLQTLH